MLSIIINEQEQKEEKVLQCIQEKSKVKKEIDELKE